MYWVEFLEQDLAGGLSPTVGDRGIVFLDGRNTIQRMREDARLANGQRRPEFPAAQILEGETLSRGRKRLTEVFYL